MKALPTVARLPAEQEGPWNEGACRPSGGAPCMSAGPVSLHPCVPGGASLVSATGRGSLPGEGQQRSPGDQRRDHDRPVLSRSGPWFPHLYTGSASRLKVILMAEVLGSLGQPGAACVHRPSHTAEAALRSAAPRLLQAPLWLLLPAPSVLSDNADLPALSPTSSQPSLEGTAKIVGLRKALLPLLGSMLRVYWSLSGHVAEGHWVTLRAGMLEKN